MRVIDAIRLMSLDELAPLLIKQRAIYYGDERRWTSPSGNKFDYYDDAIEDCIKWLDSEYKGEGQC